MVLIRFARMLKNIINANIPDGEAGRWGGEEFMVLLPDADEKRAAQIAELFRQHFAMIPFEKAGKQTVSVGVTEIRADENTDAACMRVDDALYEAKRTGKNKVVVH